MNYVIGEKVKISHRDTPTTVRTFDAYIYNITEWDVFLFDVDVSYYFERDNITFSSDNGIWVRKTIYQPKPLIK